VKASPSLRDNFAATVELYSTFIKQMEAESPQLNVYEVSFARGKAGKNSYGKRHSTGISNVSNAAVDDRLFEKHEYNALTPDHKNTLRLKRLKRDHVERSILELATTMARTMGNEQQSSPSPVPAQH
jgi:hypothetical protein